MAREGKHGGMLVVGILLVLVGCAACLAGIVMIAEGRAAARKAAGSAVNPAGKGNESSPGAGVASQNDDLLARCESLQKSLNTAESKLAGAEERLAIMEKAGGVRNDTLNELKLARDDMEAQMKKAMGERDGLAKRLAQMQSDLETAKAGQTAAQADAARLKSEAAATTASAAGLANKCAQLEKQCKELEDKLAAVTAPPK